MSFDDIRMFSFSTIFSDITSLSDPVSSIAYTVVETPEWESMTRIGTMGLMISSSADTRFLIVVAPSHTSVFPLGSTAAVATAPSGGRIVLGVVVSMGTASLGVLGEFLGALGTGGVLPWRMV